MEEREEEIEEICKKKRNFKSIYRDIDGKIIVGNKYRGSRPLQAAKKAATKLYEYCKENNCVERIENGITFALYEITRNCENRKFWYIGKVSYKKPEYLYKLPPDYLGEKKKNKFIFTEKEIEEMGGFEKIYNKKKEDIIPSIIYDKVMSAKPLTKHSYKNKNISIPGSFFNENDTEEDILKLEDELELLKLNRKGYKKSVPFVHFYEK